MAISSTYGAMQRQIIDELGDRSDLLASRFASANSPIKQAIQSAIAKWERENFYFNETYTVPLFTTVASQEFYDTDDAADIATSPDIYSLHALISSNRYPLTRRSWDYIEEFSISPTSTGQPQDWAYYGLQIRLYPIPDGAYPIRASSTIRPSALSADADTNVWMQDAYDLIRCEAKRILAADVVNDPELAAKMQAEIYGSPMNPRDRGYLGALKAETFRRGRSGRVTPTQF